MKKRQTIEIGTTQLDDEERELEEEMSKLESNLRRIQDLYMNKINFLKQMSKAQSEKTLKLNKEILQLKKVNQTQKEEVEKIMKITNSQPIKVTTPRTIKKISNREETQKSPPCSPSTKGMGSSHRMKKKSSDLFRKSTDLQTTNKILKNIDFKKITSKNSPYKEVSEFSASSKTQNSAKTTKNIAQKIGNQKNYRETVHIFK